MTPGRHCLACRFAIALIAACLPATAMALATPAVILVGVLPTLPLGGTQQARATLAGNSPVPTGTVDFYQDSTVVCAAVAVVNGIADCTYAASVPGVHSLSAAYGGDSTYDAATSPAMPFTVMTSTSTTVVSSRNPATAGEVVTYTATVTPEADAGALGGTVAFLVGTAPLSAGVCDAVAVDANGRAACTVGPLDHGMTVTAQYSGANLYLASQGSVSQFLPNAYPVVALRLPEFPTNGTVQVTLAGASMGGDPQLLPAGLTIEDLDLGQVVCSTFSPAGTGIGTAVQCNPGLQGSPMGYPAGVHHLVAHYSGDLNYYPADSARFDFATGGATPPRARKPMDLNGDGKADLAWLSSIDGSVAVWRMDGVQVIDSRLALDLTGAPADVTGIASVHPAGDLSGDGIGDMLGERVSSGQWGFLQDGILSTQLNGNVSAMTGLRLAGTGDFNADGVAEMLLQNPDGSVDMQSLDLPPQRIMPAGTHWTVALVGDFNGDRKDDIVWQNVDGTTSMWLMNGASILSRGPLVPAGSVWRATHVGDFNGDGKDDLVWTSSLDGSVSMWLMDGLAPASRGPLLSGGLGWSVKLVGDFDGNGTSDLVFQNTDGSAGMWLMDGLTATSRHALFGSGNAWTPRIAADYDGNGTADLVWTHPDGAAGLWLMNGATVVARTPLMGPQTTWSLVTP